MLKWASIIGTSLAGIITLVTFAAAMHNANNARAGEIREMRRQMDDANTQTDKRLTAIEKAQREDRAERVEQARKLDIALAILMRLDNRTRD